MNIILKERFARINEKTVRITSGCSILIRQNIAFIDNFDVSLTAHFLGDSIGNNREAPRKKRLDKSYSTTHT